MILDKEVVRRVVKSALLEARFQGWEDRDCGDEWDAMKAVPECGEEADRVVARLFDGLLP